MAADTHLLGDSTEDQTNTPGCPDENDTTVCRYLAVVIQEEDDLWGYLSHVGKIFNQSVIATFLRVIVTLSAFAVFIIGFLWFQKCTLEPEIPLFLVLEGAVIIVKATVHAINNCQRSRTPGEGDRNTLDTISDILTLFLVLWTLTGAVWVFGAFRIVNVEDATSREYCDSTVYTCSLVLLLTLVVTGVAVGAIIAALSALYCYKHKGATAQYSANTF